MMKSESILRVSDLYVSHGDRTAVRGVGFEILRGERVGLVGESGSGKSMTALSIMGLLPAGGGPREALCTETTNSSQ